MISNVTATVGFTVECRDLDAAHEKVVDLLSAIDDPSLLFEPDIMEMDCS